jgi:hypothetical protein
LRKERCIFTCASANFQQLPPRRESLEKSNSNCTALCRDARPRAESIVEGIGDRFEGKRGGTK